MKTTTISTLALLVLAGAVAACGAQSSAADPAIGTYALDVDDTLQAATMLAGANKAGAEARAAALRSQLGPEAYRLELRAGDLFELVIAQGETRFILGGTWTRVPEGIELRTTSVNGQPPEEGVEHTETVTLEGDDRLVLTQADETIYLVRQ